jgi:hypothetical protein
MRTHTRKCNAHDYAFDLCAGDCHLELIAYRTFEVGFMSEVDRHANARKRIARGNDHSWLAPKREAIS